MQGTRPLLPQGCCLIRQVRCHRGGCSEIVDRELKPSDAVFPVVWRLEEVIGLRSWGPEGYMNRLL